VVLDFTAVNFLDVTATQALVDLRNQFNRYSEPDIVEWHFAGVANRWTKRALVAAGFGSDRIHAPENSGEKGASLGPLIAVTAAAASGADVPLREPKTGKGNEDIEAGEISPVSSTLANGRLVPVYGINRPFFHVDLETAIKSVSQNLDAVGSDSN